MSRFIWKEEYSLGIEIIDSQHKELVALLEKTYDNFLNKSPKDELVRLVNELDQFATIHLGTEEKYFDLFNYEGKDLHIKIHNDMRSQIATFNKRVEAEGAKVAMEIIDFLENWLIEHIENIDKKYVQCFKEHGL